MKFNVVSKEMERALQTVLMKGKYKSGSMLKTKIIGEYAFLSLTNNVLTIYNANNCCGCCINIIVEEPDSQNGGGTFVVEIEKMIKYLKSFTDIVNVSITDFILLKSGSKRASLPLVIDHPAINMVHKVIDTEITEDFPFFGKTKLESNITVLGDNLIDAVNACSVVGTGEYKLDYDGEELHISSNYNQESYKTVVPMIAHIGEPSTLVIAQPFHKFVNGLTILYMKDDAPLLMKGIDRKIVLAPRVE